MPRRPRIQFPDAIYYVVARGDGKQKLFLEDSHYEKITEGFAEEVQRSGWKVFAYCWMPNQIQLLLQTPQPNLANGMQHWISSYANWYSKQNPRAGALLQGRYKSYPVEDASYYWMLSRYIHLTPCLGKNPLAKSPKLWTNSSYAGYASKSGQVDFVNYDAMWEKVPADQEGKDPAGSYRRFVEQGLSQGVEDPLKSAQDKWVFGSPAFVKKVVKLTAGNSKRTSLRMLRRASAHTIDSVFQFVAKENKAKVADYIGFRSAAPGREIAVLLCRQFTPCTLGELSEYLGLNHPDSAANLSRRAKKMIAESPKYKKAFEAMRDKLQKTAD